MIFAFRIMIVAAGLIAIYIITRIFSYHHSTDRTHYKTSPNKAEMQFYHKVSEEQRTYLPVKLKNTDKIIIQSSDNRINKKYIMIDDIEIIKQMVSSMYINYYRILQPDILLPDMSIKFYQKNSLLATVDYQQDDDLSIYGNP